MVGLKILLEAHRGLDNNSPQIINQATILRPSSSTSPPSPSSSSSSSSSSCSFSTAASTFLDACFLCKKRLSPHKDIYMYRGDRAFCSMECRCRQIFMDEETQDQTHPKDNCSSAAGGGGAAAAAAASGSHSRRRKGNRNRAGGLFAY